MSTGKVTTVAGDTSQMGNTAKRRWARDRPSVVDVPCMPLLTIYDDAMQAHTAEQRSQQQPWKRGERVTYLSLDVEGSELVVLQSVPHLQEHPFDVLLVENEFNNARDRAVAALLKQSGYTPFLIPQPAHGGTNSLYVSPRLVPLALQLLGNRSNRWEGAYKPVDVQGALRTNLKKLGLESPVG